MSNPDDDAVHPLVRKGAAWSWRLLVMSTAAIALVWVLKHFAIIFVSLALAVIPLV